MSVKQLTKDEIDAIRHTITPIHLVKKISQKSTYIDAEHCNSKMSIKHRGESFDKL